MTATGYQPPATGYQVRLARGWRLGAGSQLKIPRRLGDEILRRRHLAARAAHDGDDALKVLANRQLRERELVGDVPRRGVHFDAQAAHAQRRMRERHVLPRQRKDGIDLLEMVLDR